jgi:uncharacterized protein with PhoU and TrkA domain
MVNSKNTNVTTVKELRTLFFDNDNFYAVLFADELTNKEVRRELYEMENQDEKLNYQINDKCVLIWKQNTC